MAFLYIKPFALLHCVSAEMGQSLCGEEANLQATMQPHGCYL